MIIDTLPDIHGRLDKLDAMLEALGYAKKRGRWTAPQEGRTLISLGDLIDRGPDQRGVIDRIRALEEDGLLRRVMGNHEMNALHWAMEREGAPARPHTPSNQAHHQAFLDAFAGDKAGYHDALDWMARAAFAITQDQCVFVHAFWTRELEAAAATALGPSLAGAGFDALANNTDFLGAAAPQGGVARALDLMTKGPESPLPAGYSIQTEHGIVRTALRRAWWVPAPTGWEDGCASLPIGSVLPTTPPPALSDLGTIPADTCVLFGHYWRRDIQEAGRIPVFQGRLACLDQSAGAGGDEPLAVLTLDTTHTQLPQDGAGGLDPACLTIVR